jgi:meso-butanediol dehydrogenase/(S,S)-butanediol dehydrogenase/diacetyl reductase
VDRLKNRTALITGGGAGIGAATALLFCTEGAAVTLVDFNAEVLDRTVQAIKDKLPGARINGFAADVADETKAQQAAEFCSSAFGGLDILVNNAAMRNYSAVADATPEEWRAMISVNLVGAANYCRAALPKLRESGQGSIVNVSSAHAVIGRKGMGLYDATKAGMLAMTRTLAFEEIKHGVRVNAMCPGSTFTEFHVGRAAAAGKSAEQLKTERSGNSLMGRWASPEEIAWPIVWLASSEASFITGTTLMVDGGLSIM